MPNSVTEMASIVGMLEDMEGKKPGEDSKKSVDELFRLKPNYRLSARQFCAKSLSYRN